MRADQFDSIVRRLAAARQSRRVLLAGVGSVGTAVLAAAHSNAEPATSLGKRSALRQVVGAGVVADQAYLLEYDAANIFRFVADEIAFEPYDGILRGAEGTLRSRAGNSLDKALLLGELLTASNIKVQYGTQPLDDAAANELAQSVVISRDAINKRELYAAIGARPLTSDTPAAQPMATPGPTDQSTLDSMSAARDAMLQFATSSSDETIALLTPAAKAGALPETVPVPDISPLQKANHGWAAYPFGTTWMYLDPTTPGAKPVQRESIATPRAATPEASPQSPAFPEEMYHAVTIRLIVEQMQGTALVQADLVTQHVHVADVDGLPITIAHMSPDALQGLGVSISGTLSGSFTQIPLVAIGDQVTQGSPYLVFGGGGGGVLGALGDAEELTDGEPTAEWIQIDTTAPDGSTTSTRRTIFDRIGDSNRADPEAAIKNLKPVPLVDVDGIGKAYLPLLSVTSLAISGSDSAAARYIPGQIPDTGVEQQANVSYAIQHYLYRLTSVLGPDLGLRLAPDGVNISSVTFSAVAGQPIDSPLVSTDVWLRNIMALPVHGETSNVAPALTIASFGLAAEELAVDSSSWINDLDLSALGLGSPPTPAVTVRSVFESAAAAKIATITLDPSDDLTSKLSLDASSSIYSLIQADLDAGRTVVVPARSVEIDGIPRIGWWAIDPRTGNVIDRMDSGGSAAYVLFSELGEYLAVLRSGLVQANQWKRMGCQAAVIALVASYLLGAPYAGYKAAKDAAAGNYVDSVADAIAGVGGATLAFLGSPAACLA